MAGDKVSFADLVIFHELVNVTTITDVKPDAEKYPKIDSWYRSMGSIESVQAAVDKFMD